MNDCDEPKYGPGAEHVAAIYTTGQRKEFDDNPLIAALQPKWTTAQIGQSMTWWPDYSPEDRKQDPEDREEAVKRLAYCFETVPEHVPVIKGILNNIKLGLIGRHRLVHRGSEEIRQKAEDLIENLIKAKETETNGTRTTSPPQGNGKSDQKHKSPPPRVAGRTMLLYGLPGTGKSSLAERIEVLIPQIIDHVTFKEKPWKCRQVVRLRIVAQRGWSDRALAEAALTEFDRAAGTNYVAAAHTTGRKGTLYSFMLQFLFAAHNHGLGMLIVDEVQLLADNDALLNFILNFNTLVGVPLLLLGTPASKDLMQLDPRYMRRSEGSFDPEFKPYRFPDVSQKEYDKMLSDPEAVRDPWTYVVEAFWHRQYCTEFTPLDYSLSKALHYYSVGIIDYAIKLFIAAQLLRIGENERDKLEVDDLKEAYFACFKVSLPYLEALREGRTIDLLKYRDFRRQDINDVAAAAAKKRLERRREDEARLLREAKERANRSRTKPKPKEPPEKVSPGELPEAPPDEYT